MRNVIERLRGLQDTVADDRTALHSVALEHGWESDEDAPYAEITDIYAVPGHQMALTWIDGVLLYVERITGASTAYAVGDAFSGPSLVKVAAIWLSDTA